jgi:hypothetical protein
MITMLIQAGWNDLKKENVDNLLFPNQQPQTHQNLDNSPISEFNAIESELSTLK